MKLRRALAPLLLLAISSALHAETIHGLCRAKDSFQLFPIALDTDTGVATPALPATLGVDAAGHFAAVMDGSGKIITAMTARQNGSGPYEERLLTIDPATGDVQTSTGALPTGIFAGSSIALIPGTSPQELVIARENGTSASVDVFRVRADTAAVLQSFNVPFTISPRAPWRTPPQLAMLESGPVLVLAPCRGDDGGSQQSLYRVDFGSSDVTGVDLQGDLYFCQHSMGVGFDNTFVILSQPAGEGLAQVALDDGSVFTRNVIPNWRMARSSPYVYRWSSQHLYALNDAQTTLAKFSLSAPSFTVVLTNVTLPANCATVTAFAGN